MIRLRVIKLKIILMMEKALTSVLENVRKERYQLPVRYNDGYKDGDMVVLSYLERTGKGDNLYETVPRSLFAASAMIEIPCKRQWEPSQKGIR